MRLCPRCTGSFEGGTLMCPSCVKRTVREIRRESAEKEAELLESEE